MKYIQFLFPVIKSFIAVAGFLIGIGWAAFASIQLIVKAESASLRTEFETKRNIDIHHIDKRFDETQAMIRALRK